MSNHITHDLELASFLDYHKLPMREARYNPTTRKVEWEFLSTPELPRLVHSWTYEWPLVDIRAYLRAYRRMWNFVRDLKPPRTA